MRTAFYVLAIAMLSFSTSSCKHQEEQEATEQVKFVVTTPILKDTSIVKSYVSQVRAIQHIELRALEQGYLQDIFVDEGKPVKKGQLMFRIMPLVYRSEMEKAKAEANYAEIEFKNTKSLADKNVVSPNELALAKARYDKALAELNLAQTKLGFTEIRAPFDGIMDRLQVRKGSLLNDGDLLTTLSDNSKMWVYYNVPEAEYLSYKANPNSEKLSSVNLQMANQQIFEQAGTVETIEADFNNETGNIAFRATFPNPKGLLRHGETGNILMTVPLPHALIIPQKATFEILEKKYVFVIDRDSVVRQREITIAAEMPDLYVVKDGLGASDRILLEGLRKVRDKDKIQFTYQAPTEVMAHLRVYAE